MRTLAIDFGTRRIGLSYGDEIGVATPLPAITTQDVSKHWGELAAVLKERLQSQGAIPSGMAPAEFGRFIAAETKKWAQVVKASGAKID